MPQAHAGRKPRLTPVRDLCRSRFLFIRLLVIITYDLTDSSIYDKYIETGLIDYRYSQLVPVVSQQLRLPTTIPNTLARARN